MIATTAGYVLVGGRSSRFGSDKALAPWQGRPLVLSVADEVRAAAGSVSLVGAPENYAALGLPVIADAVEGFGPLAGVAAALAHTRAAWSLIVACDMPYLTREFLVFLLGTAQTLPGESWHGQTQGVPRQVSREQALQRQAVPERALSKRAGRGQAIPEQVLPGQELAGFALPEEGLKAPAAPSLSPADVVLPADRRGRLEPLCAVYSKRCAEPIAGAVRRGVHKMTDGLQGLRARRLPFRAWADFDRDGLLFANLNTPADFEAAREAR